MLSTPADGWTVVTVKDCDVIASYIVDIPFEWLSACLDGLKNERPVALEIDSEGTESFIVTHYGYTFVVGDSGGGVPYCRMFRYYSFLDLIGELIEDFKRDFDDWVRWGHEEKDDGFLSRRAEELRKLIIETESALNEAK